MIELNAVGRDALRAAGGAHALTDVTGYGLAGHALEMAEGAGLTFEIDVASLPVIEGAEPLAIPRYHTRASKSNREFVEGRLQVDPRRRPAPSRVRLRRPDLRRPLDRHIARSRVAF